MKKSKAINQFRAVLERTLEKNIATYGMGVLYVMGDDDTPPFAYTVGLADEGLPELIVFGLPAEAAHPTLNALAAELRETRGASPRPGNVLTHVFQGLPAMLLYADRPQADAFMTAAHARHPDYRVMQLIWPDPDGHFPWQAEFDTDLHACQPLLNGPRPSTLH